MILDLTGDMRLMKKIEDQKFDCERALYALSDTKVYNCDFAGEADGESVLKEARNISVEKCRFSLRYPMWHVKGFELKDSSLDEATRAPIWYAHDGIIENTEISSVKAVRECSNIDVKGSRINSVEFGWKCDKITLEDSTLVSEYVFLDSKNIRLSGVDFRGKYSFQYVHDLLIENCTLDTKDAFWHAENVRVVNSTIKGEYLAWFSKGLTLENCHIIGTQPFCYCEDLKLINCTMTDCDLSFEYSDVDADVSGHIMSVKNIKSGVVYADSVGEIINEDAVMECRGTVVLK